MPRPDFARHIALSDAFLASRPAMAERIERRLLNVKDKPASRIRERRYFDEALASCMFADLPRDTAALHAALAAARAADGFEPFFHQGHPHQLDPAELIVRAYAHWDRTRWPGASARQAFAHSLCHVFVLGHLQDLTLRIWDDGGEDAAGKLRAVQHRLDALNDATPSGALVRDARWLLQVAQGPLTKGLVPYFRVAETIAATFRGDDAIAVHAAGARLTGGHLRSQLHARAAELGQPIDSPQVRAVTRNSNAMDVALLVWDLVALLETYETSSAGDDDGAKVALRDTLLQGLSADPELLIVRLDLLGPCTVVESAFVRPASAGAALTETGRTHARVLERYGMLLDRVTLSLLEQMRAFEARPDYSPLGAGYGFCGDLLSNMAAEGLRGGAAPEIALEDVFATGGDVLRKQARARFSYSADRARDALARTRRALEQRAAHPGLANAAGTRDGRIVVRLDAAVPPDAQEYCVTSDVNLALATGATAFPRGQIAIDREEGRFLASAETNGRWFGLSKVVLTDRIERGEDATITVPEEVSQILRLTCPALIRAGG